MKSFVVNAAIESTKFSQDFDIEFYCIVTEDMTIPEYLKESTGLGNAIMFSASIKNSWDQEYDYETQTAIWTTTFNGNPFTIYLPLNCIVAITNKNDTMIQFTAPISPTGEPGIMSTDAPVIAPVEPPKLELVSDNGPDFVRTPPKGELELVPDDTEEDTDETQEEVS